MMYAKGKDFIKDYAERTMSNYRQISAGPYEVTQLLNSAIGLLIIPQQKQFDKITDSIVSDELLQKMTATVKKNTYKSPLNLAQVASRCVDLIQPKTKFSTSSAIGGFHHIVISSRNSLELRDFLLFIR